MSPQTGPPDGDQTDAAGANVTEADADDGDGDASYSYRCHRCGADIRPVPAGDVADMGGAYVARDGWAWCDDLIDHAPAPPSAAKPGMWGVRVNETQVSFCTGPGVADWWLTHRQALAVSGQLHTLQEGVGGGICWIGPWEWAAAEFMRTHMIYKGVPSKAVQLIRSPEGTGR
jgi:hypothetical protein